MNVFLDFVPSPTVVDLIVIIVMYYHCSRVMWKWTKKQWQYIMFDHEMFVIIKKREKFVTQVYIKYWKHIDGQLTWCSVSVEIIRAFYLTLNSRLDYKMCGWFISFRCFVWTLMSSKYTFFRERERLLCLHWFHEQSRCGIKVSKINTCRKYGIHQVTTSLWCKRI